MIEDIKNITLEQLTPEILLKQYSIIDGVKLHIIDGHIEKIISSNISGPFLKMWTNSRGGILYHDIKKYLKTNEFPRYYIMTSNDITEHLIIRLIEDDEVEHFTLRRLNNGKIKDFNYMILKDLALGFESLQKSSEYIERLPIDNTEVEIDETDDNYIPLIDEASSEHNISLFKD